MALLFHIATSILQFHPDTARWIAQNIGEAEIKEFQEGISYGAHLMRDGINLNTTERIKALLLPSEILNLERLHLVLKMADFPAVRTNLRYKERKECSPRFVMGEEMSSTSVKQKTDEKGKRVDAEGRRDENTVVEEERTVVEEEKLTEQNFKM